MLIYYILSQKQGGGYDVEHGFKEYGAFEKWLQCYQNPKMKSLTDRKKRTIWFDGEPGFLVPKGTRSWKLIFILLKITNNREPYIRNYKGTILFLFIR